MKTKIVAILLVICLLSGCAYGQETYATDETGMMQNEIYIEESIYAEDYSEASEATNATEIVETIDGNSAIEENTVQKSDITVLAEQCASMTGEDNEERATNIAERVAKSKACTADDLMILASSEYPYVWYYGIKSEKNTEETMKKFAAKILTLGKNEDRLDNLVEAEWIHTLCEVMVESDSCTLAVLEILVTCEHRYAWKFAVLDEDNSEETLYRLAQNVATIDGDWVDEEWAERLAEWIVLHDKCTDKVRGALMYSPFESVWEVAMFYE